MRILLDHCLPHQIAGLLPGHEVTIARQMGWDALLNGDLLLAAEQGGFECLLTGDRNMAYQQNLGGRLETLLPYMQPFRCHLRQGGDAEKSHIAVDFFRKNADCVPNACHFTDRCRI